MTTRQDTLHPIPHLARYWTGHRPTRSLFAVEPVLALYYLPGYQADHEGGCSGVKGA
jgi:hypothetical protein